MPRQIQQSFVKVQPDGSVLFDFDGHVHAEGVDLDAGTNLTPPDDRKVRWIKESNGAVIAELFGVDSGADSHVFVQSLSDTNGANATLQARDGGREAGFFATHDASAHSRVEAFTGPVGGIGGHRTVLLDSNRKSSYVFSGSGFEEMQIIWTGVALDVYVDRVLVRSL